MSEAVRKVTIIVDVKPGDIQMPDVGWITEAQTELKDLVDKQTDVADIVKKTRQETEELVKVQTESAKVQTELDEQKAESANAAKDAGAKEVEEHKKTLQAKKTNTEEWEENLKKRQAEWAENQRKIDEEAAKRKTDLLEKEKQAVESHEKTVKQIQQQYQGDPSVRPLTEPGQNPTAVKPLNGDPAVRPLFDPEQPDTRMKSQQGRIIPPSSGPPNDPPDETFDETARRLRERTEAARRRLEEIEANKGAQNDRWEQESRESREATTANDDMPKHWRNVGLNAGQAVASVARYIGHMRMLKNIGGDALESIAKEFMTVQSRVETVSAATSAFTNVGTMLDGLQKAGTETAKIVARQTELGAATSLTQVATMKLGTTAAAITPMIAPMQFAFTAITAAVVAADIAMDFLTESTEEAKQKAEEYQVAFNKGLSETIEKLKTQTDMIKGQSTVLIEQWEIKKLLAGEDGLSPQEISKRNEEMRQRSDTDAMRKIKTSVTDVFQSGMTEEQQSESGRLVEERKKATEELKKLKEELAYREATEPTETLSAQARGARRIQYEDPITRLEAELRKLDNDQSKFDMMTGKQTQESIGQTKIKDGVVVDFAELERQLDSLPKSMQESGKKMFLVIENELLGGAQTNREQLAESQQAARNAKVEKLQQENVLKDLTASQKDEMALANRFNLQESKIAMQEVDILLRETEKPTATIDQKSQSVESMRKVLGQANLMTPELSDILARGASASPQEIKDSLADAQQYTPAEQKEANDLMEKANKAIQKSEEEAAEMTAIAETLTRLLEQNSKQLQQLRQALDARDGI